MSEHMCIGNNLFCDIASFNKMYKLHKPTMPTVINGRLEDFQKILNEEFLESDDILGDKLSQEDPIPSLVAMADWLGDIVIYCLSEMLRWGLAPEEVLRIIMQSNFSKLGEDGQPIYDERGKLMKGPNYLKPEPKLEEYIRGAIDGK